MLNNFFNTLKNDYSLDRYSIILFILVSFSFPNTYYYVIPLILGLTLFQFYRLITNQVSLTYLSNTYMLLLVFSLPFFRSIHTILLVTCILIQLYRSYKNHLVIIKKDYRFESYVIIFFGLIVFNLLIHTPILKGIEIFLYLLLYPILFVSIKNQPIQVQGVKFIKVYITSVFVSTIYLFLIGVFYQRISFETNTYFAEPLGLIHVYFGMFVGLAACFVLALKVKNDFWITRTFDFIVFILFIVVLIYIGARTALIAVILVTSLAIYYKIRTAWYKKGTILILTLLGMLYVSYHTIPRAKSDLKYTVNVYNSIKTNNIPDLTHNSWRNMYKRFLVLKYSMVEIKEHFFLGIGIKNVKDDISKKILDDGYIYFKPMNTHNQYLHFLVGLGAPSFLFFLWLLFKFIKENRNNKYALFFITYCLVIMLTESILVRNKGISLFFLFYLIFNLEKKLNNNYLDA